MDESYIGLAHGNGGRFMRELIADVFLRHLRNPELDADADAVPLALPDGEVVLTTDGFTVQPLEFPGGTIGSLAVHGTVNDLAVVGATPHYMSLSAIIEEGLEIARLERIVESLGAAARESGARVVAGDTKVVRRGEGSGLYLTATGVGVRARGLRLGLREVRAGDQLLVSGPIGDHGTAVLLAREEFGLRGDLVSDAASVLPLTQAMLGVPGVRFMRDPTRGGLATVVHEVVRASRLEAHLDGPAIPVREPVRSVCDTLGYDPLYLACEGRIVVVVAPEQARTALESLQSLPAGREAAIIGELSGPGSRVVLRTELGGERYVEELEDDPLPRIC